MVEQARAKGLAARLAVVSHAMESADESVALRASTWWLEHVFPEHFARNRLEVTGADGSPLAGVVAIMLPPKADSLPAVTVPALREGRPNGNGG